MTPMTWIKSFLGLFRRAENRPIFSMKEADALLKSTNLAFAKGCLEEMGATDVAARPVQSDGKVVGFVVVGFVPPTNGGHVSVVFGDKCAEMDEAYQGTLAYRERRLREDTPH